VTSGYGLAVPSTDDKPLCFAIMPITTPEDAVAKYGGDQDHFVHVAEFIFKPAAELAGYMFVPAAVDSSRVIQAAIIDNLANAHVVLCDTSLWNANVFFELGIRVALNKPVALVRDKLITRFLLTTHRFTVTSTTTAWIRGASRLRYRS
jgi:hypothetical protein